jgi:hypothetical protein
MQREINSSVLYFIHNTISKDKIVKQYFITMFGNVLYHVSQHIFTSLHVCVWDLTLTPVQWKGHKAMIQCNIR